MGGVLKNLGFLMVWLFFAIKPLFATQLVAESAEPTVSEVCDVTNEVVSHAPACLDALPMSAQTKSIASDSVWYDVIWQHLTDTWTQGAYELYVPFWSYHFPFAYSPEERALYTEYPFGAGLGRGRYNSRGDWEGFYAMGFADSHGRPYFQAGFGWIPTWRPIDDKFRLGFGPTVFLFFHEEINEYRPLPGLLPVGSIGYDKIDVHVAYVPGFKNIGNVVFWFAKYAFGG